MHKPKLLSHLFGVLEHRKMEEFIHNMPYHMRQAWDFELSSFSQGELGELFICNLWSFRPGLVSSFLCSGENFLLDGVCEQYRERAAKRILNWWRCVIKLLLSTLQHFRRIHLYIKNEYANCSHSCISLRNLYQANLIWIALFFQQTSSPWDVLIWPNSESSLFF